MNLKLHVSKSSIFYFSRQLFRFSSLKIRVLVEKWSFIIFETWIPRIVQLSVIKTTLIFSFRIVQSVSPSLSPSPPFKSDPVKDESHKHELSTLRKRLIEAEGTIRKLEQLVKSQATTARNTNGISSYGDARRLEAEIRNLRAENEKLEEKLRVRNL